MKDSAQSAQIMRGAKHRPKWTSAAPTYALRGGTPLSDETEAWERDIQSAALRSRELWEWQTNTGPVASPVKPVAKRAAKRTRRTQTA